MQAWRHFPGAISSDSPWRLFRVGFTHVTTLANRNCSFRSDTISKVLRDQTAYNILCVRFTSLVHESLQSSVTGNTAPPEAQHSIMVGG